MKREFLVAAVLSTAVFAPHQANAATVYVCDGTSIFSVDTVSGARTVIAGTGVGTGVTMLTPRGIVAISPTQLAVSATVGSSQGMVAVVDLNTLDRTSLSQFGDGKGLDWAVAGGIGQDASGNLYVMDPDMGVLRIHPTTGIRTRLSGGSVGTGIGLEFSRDALPFDANRTFVSGGVSGSIFLVDNATGNRSDVYTDPPALTGPSGLAIDPGTGQVLIAESGAGYIVRWNPDALTGAIASATTGTTFVSPYDVAVAEDGTIYVVDTASSTRGVAIMDGVTGAVTPISANAAGWNVGSGTEFSAIGTRFHVATPVTSTPSSTHDWAEFH